MCLLESCCGCCSLRTGSKVIGYLTLVFGCMAFLGLVALLMAPYPVGGRQIAPLVTMLLSNMVHKAYAVVMTLLQITLAIILIIGAHMEKKMWILFWIPAFLLVLFLQYVIVYVLQASIESSCPVPDWIDFVVISLIPMAVQLYFVWVAFSYYKQLSKTNETERMYRNATTSV